MGLTRERVRKIQGAMLGAVLGLTLAAAITLAGWAHRAQAHTDPRWKTCMLQAEQLQAILDACATPPVCPPLVVPPESCVCNPTLKCTWVGGDPRDLHIKCRAAKKQGMDIERCTVTFWHPATS